MQGTGRSAQPPGAGSLGARSPSWGRSPSRRTASCEVLDTQHRAVRGLIRNGGDVFHALSERKDQLRGLIENSNAVFQTTARRNADLEQLFEILPTFQRESRATLDRLNSFAANTDPLVRQLQPAARELSPTLIAAGKAAPDLQRFFAGLRGTIKYSDTGFPALRRLLSDDFTPLLSRLGSSVGGRDPYLAHLNSIVEVIRAYKHEVAAFFANAASATNNAQPAFQGSDTFVKLLRTTSPLNPETLASFDNQLRPVRSNPYFKPLGYNELKPIPGSSIQGLADLRQHLVLGGDHGDPAAAVPGRQRPELQRPHRWRPGQIPRRSTSTTGSSATRWPGRRTPTTSPRRPVASRGASSRSARTRSSASICTCASSPSPAPRKPMHGRAFDGRLTPLIPSVEADWSLRVVGFGAGGRELAKGADRESRAIRAHRARQGGALHAYQEATDRRLRAGDGRGPGGRGRVAGDRMRTRRRPSR